MGKRLALEGEISSLLQKRAIYAAPMQGARTGFMSTFFLVPKKEVGEWRPILNLKPLNRFIRPQRFRMETLRTILESIVTPAWGASLDLRDAYLHVPIRPEDRKFLRFMYNSVMYEFATLPFGLSTSPRVFTRVVKTIGAALQRRGVMIFMYLDDWLVVGPSRAATDAALRLTWHLTSDLGFLVNVEKSHPIPSQNPTFLGAALDLRPPRGLARPTEDRVLNLFQCVSFFSQRLWHRQGLGSGSLALWPAWWTWWIFVDSGCGQFSSICCLFTALDTTLTTCRYPLRPG